MFLLCSHVPQGQYAHPPQSPPGTRATRLLRVSCGGTLPPCFDYPPI